MIGSPFKKQVGKKVFSKTGSLAEYSILRLTCSVNRELRHLFNVKQSNTVKETKRDSRRKRK